MPKPHSHSTIELLKDNFRAAKAIHPLISDQQLATMRDLTETLRLSVVRGELILIEGKWFVSHSGLLRIAHRSRCLSIKTAVIHQLSDPPCNRWVFKAHVLKAGAKIFVGYGDADPSNVSQLVRGAEMRVAETRAVNRALRKAYGIGLCSVEEIGSVPRSTEPDQQHVRLPTQSANGNGACNGNDRPRVRDRLVQLIRQHQLNPDLVKAYAIDFCGAKTLKEATRAQVESFVDHLADWAAKDRDALVCQLNSYPLATDKNEQKGGAA
jgi:hypothetical protein